MKFRRLLASVVIVLIAALGLTACAGNDTAKAAIDAGATVIDVRTPSEYAGGNIDGALNIDVSAADFVERINALPKDETYVVYCRSGNRSAAAIAIMEEQGFTDLVDGGAYSSLK